MNPETRARVEGAVKSLGYAPNAMARGLRKGESKTIGIISLSSTDPYFAEILHGT